MDVPKSVCISFVPCLSVLLCMSCSCMLPVLCRDLSLCNFLHCHLFFSHRRRSCIESMLIVEKGMIILKYILGK
jgi:hypothetical protein